MDTQDLTVPKSLAARVRAGVAFLDAQTPDWPQQVTVETLNMSSTCNCMLGQVYGNYNDALELWFGDDESTAVRHGFDANEKGGSYSSIRAEFFALHRLWSFVIRQRQAVSQ